MNGRIEREPVPVPQVKPGIFQSWRELGHVVAAWFLFIWFLTMFVRGREVGPWELAGFMVALVAVAGWVGDRGRER